MSHALSLRSGVLVTLLYLLLALALTWPVASVCASRVPGDLGDPLLNMWILGWDLDHLTRFCAGEPLALRGFWNANIFYPTPLTLAYSEHLLPLAVQALPLYLLTHSLVLCYNLLFLSTFVLSALGAYLLARALTESPRAAFLAGLFYGFALYRIDQIGHLQVLSSQWMPFALLGLWRFAETRQTGPLIGAALALLAQGLSCGYYLFFFWPFAAAFAVWALWRHERIRDRRAWSALVLAAAATALTALPFLLPYAELRAASAILRTPGEIAMFSADLAAFGRTDRTVRLWGQLHRGPGVPIEGDLFPGLVPLVLAALACVATVRVARAARPGARLHTLLREPNTVIVSAALAAALLACGPTIRLAAHVAVPGPYALLYRLVPGFDGLRVPSRFGMLLAMFVALSAAEGTLAIAERRRGLMLAACAALFLIEGTCVPVRTSQILRERGLRKPLPLDLPAPPVYAHVQRLPREAVLIELPFGAPAYDLRAVFYSTTHWRRLVNGYSGALPAGYAARASALRGVVSQPETALRALATSGATHAIVHEHAWRVPQGEVVSAWLSAHGARRLATLDGDVLFELPAATHLKASPARLPRPGISLPR
jgi:hypothetical protein